MSAALAEKRALPKFADEAGGPDQDFEDDTLMAAAVLEPDAGPAPEAPAWEHYASPAVEPPPFPPPRGPERPAGKTAPEAAAPSSTSLPPPRPKPRDPADPAMEALFDALTVESHDYWDANREATLERAPRREAVQRSGGPQDDDAPGGVELEPVELGPTVSPGEIAAHDEQSAKDAVRPILDAPVSPPPIAEDAGRPDEARAQAAEPELTPPRSQPVETDGSDADRPSYEAGESDDAGPLEEMDEVAADADRDHGEPDGLLAGAEGGSLLDDLVAPVLVEDEADALDDAAAEADLPETWSPLGSNGPGQSDGDDWSFLDRESEFDDEDDAPDLSVDAEEEDDPWAGVDWLAEADEDDADLAHLGDADPYDNLGEDEIAHIRARRTAAQMVAQMDLVTRKRRDATLNRLTEELIDFDHGSTRAALLRLAPEIDDEADLFAACALKRLWREESRFWMRRVRGVSEFDAGGADGLSWPLAMKLIAEFGDLDPEEIIWPLYEEWLENGASRQNAVSFAMHLHELMNETERPGPYFDRDTDPADRLAGALRLHAITATHPNRLGAGIRAKNF